MDLAFWSTAFSWLVSNGGFVSALAMLSWRVESATDFCGKVTFQHREGCSRAEWGVDKSNSVPKSPSPAGGLASGVTEIALEETASTNAHALELLRSGAAPEHLTLVWARRQTKGRGRGDRAWQSPEGNVFFSMVLRPQADWGDLSQLPLVTAVATHAAIRPHVPAARALTLKWPNDVLIDGAKVSGTLIESHRLTYLESAHGLGESITVRTSLDLDESISGVFEGINQDGALLLRLGDGTVRQLVVGDVFFGNPRNAKETP